MMDKGICRVFVEVGLLTSDSMGLQRFLQQGISDMREAIKK